MSDQLTSAECQRLHERCLELYGDTINRHGRAVQIDELRFVVDCLSCNGSGERPARPGVRSNGGAIGCPRCGGSAKECVGVLAARNLLGGDDKIDYLPGWDFERALEAARAETREAAS